MRILIILIASVISGVLYRLGGSAKRGVWLDAFRNTKTRDVGCPLISFVAIWLLGPYAHWGIHLAAGVLAFAALTTYWDKVFGYDNHYAHGLMIGLAYIPYLMVFPLYLILGRALALSFAMGAFSKHFNYDVAEEGSRGFFIPLTLLLLV